MGHDAKTKAHHKVFYGIAGVVCLAVGILFLFLPVLPTVPFLILSAYCFSRVSRRIQHFLRSLPYVGKWMDPGRRPKLKRPIKDYVALFLVFIALLGGSLFVWAWMHHK